MCRLYGLRASHPTTVACELLDAQNALIRQADRDGRGLENPHGWGIGWVEEDGTARCERQAGPADESAEFRGHALSVRSRVVIAHVRRATVGGTRLANTHPFRDGDTFLAHNGHVGHFDLLGPMLRAALPPARRAAIRGSTDSEQFFQLVRAEMDGGADPVAALRAAADQVWAWGAALDAPTPLFLNTLMVHEGELFGTRLDRTLWVLERDAAPVCARCGLAHANVAPGEPYRAVIFASERLSDEDWRRVPEASVFRVTHDLRLEVAALFGEGSRILPTPRPGLHAAVTAEDAAEEIDRLHGIFESWLSGEAADAAGVDTMHTALDPAFVLVPPSGVEQRRDPLLAQIRAARGRRPGLRIWIEGLEVRHAHGGQALVRYEEWQREDAAPQPHGRVATALLTRDPAAPSGLRWLHVHETAMPPAA